MYYYFKNAQGDIYAIVDSTGAKVAQYTYDAWGNILTVTDGNGVAVASSNKTHIANLNPFRYRGYYYDTESNIYYLQSRYYDPTLGRFISADEPAILGLTIGQPLGANLFIYCNNNSINRIDSEGCISTSYAPKKTYLFVYDKPGSDFIEQGKIFKNSYLKGNKFYGNRTVEVIYFRTREQLKNGFNSMKNPHDIIILAHGYPGHIAFDPKISDDIDLAYIKNNFNKISITGKIYLFSCNGGTLLFPKDRESSVAAALAAKVNGKPVLALVNGFVTYRAWWQPFMGMPLTKTKGAYWAFHTKVQDGYGYLRIVNIGRLWYF